MQSNQKRHRQSKSAIITSYIFYRWFLALMTCFILCIYDFLIYQNTKLIFSDKFLIFETGALTKKSKEIPYEDILNVRAKQSLIGQIFNYGTITATMKNGVDTITFKYAHEPESVRRAIQEAFVSSSKFKIN
jgi:uncharacterized membrane protein YdbT with pleckstrin-like domain